MKGKKLKRKGRRVELVKRKCLGLECDRTFTARGRFERLCPKCKKTIAFVFGEDDVKIGGF